MPTPRPIPAPAARAVPSAHIRRGVVPFRSTPGGCCGTWPAHGARRRGGADPNYYSNTPLHAAAEVGDADAVRLMLAAGADPNSKDEDGHTALQAGAGLGLVGVLRHLLVAGADPNTQGRNGCTALHSAIFWRRPEAVELLLQHGANVPTTNDAGRDALAAAREAGWPEILELLEPPRSASVNHRA